MPTVRRHLAPHVRRRDRPRSPFATWTSFLLAATLLDCTTVSMFALRDRRCVSTPTPLVGLGAELYRAEGPPLFDADRASAICACAVPARCTTKSGRMATEAHLATTVRTAIESLFSPRFASSPLALFSPRIVAGGLPRSRTSPLPASSCRRRVWGRHAAFRARSADIEALNPEASGASCGQGNPTAHAGER